MKRVNRAAARAIGLGAASLLLGLGSCAARVPVTVSADNPANEPRDTVHHESQYREPPDDPRDCGPHCDRHGENCFINVCDPSENADSDAGTEPDTSGRLAP